MLRKSDVISAIKISRLIVYMVTAVVYIYGRFFFYHDTLCNNGFTCPFCGLRTAMYYIEHGRITDACNSNKLCILVIIFFSFAIIDMTYICVSYMKKRVKTICDRDNKSSGRP